MEEKVFTIVNTIIGIVLSGGIGILIFWLRKFVNTVEEHSKIINEIRIDFANRNGSCDEKHKGINERISTHGRQIDDLYKKSEDYNVRISKLEP